MKQVVQSVRDGRLRVVDLPRPSIGPTEVLVAPTHSVVSAGTERAVRQLASSSLLAKARARPDLARKVIRRARAEGLAPGSLDSPSLPDQVCQTTKTLPLAAAATDGSCWSPWLVVLAR